MSMLTLRMLAMLSAMAAQLVAVSCADSYQELFYPQKLDHFNPANLDQWNHRYLLNNQSWDGRGELPNGCRGPILLYTGNEGDITAFWDSNGFMIEDLAPRWGALLLFPEQRYYGKSLPFGNTSFTASNLRYLTTAQVLEDYAALVTTIKQTHNAQNCPVIAFGGSYGGTLTALLRAAHPTIVTGGLAASSELGYYDSARWAEHGVDQFRFEDIVVGDYTAAHPGCMDSIRQVQDALNQESISVVADKLHTCSTAALAPLQSSLYTYALEGLPQMDYPYQIGSMPASPVNVVCAAATNATAEYARTGDRSVLIAAAATVTDMFFGYDGSTCVPAQPVGGPGNTPGDGPGPGAWGYQSCTEALHPFSARGLRNYTFSYEASAVLCNDLYGLKPDLYKIVEQFGGYQLADGSAGVSHLIWSQGTLDPWHGWFNEMKAPSSESNVYHFLMKGSAHHLDLKSPNPADPADVTAARAQYVEIMRRWILEASQKL